MVHKFSFIFLVFSLNLTIYWTPENFDVLQLTYVHHDFQILLTFKKKQWCKAIESSITALSAIVLIRLKECCLLKPCIPEAPCIILPGLKLRLFWHDYFFY